jgi:hypothetical protein
MKTRGKLFCVNGCGELPSLKREPTTCPICGGEIQFVPDETKKLYPTSDERAAEWFQKMRDAVEKANP